MTITITPEIEKGLTEEARRQGTTPETLALDALQERFALSEVERMAEGSAYDLFAGHPGRIHGSSEALSQDTGRRFTEYVVKKQQEGRL